MLIIITCAVSILSTVRYFGLQSHLIFNPKIHLTHHQQKVSFSVDWYLKDQVHLAAYYIIMCLSGTWKEVSMATSKPLPVTAKGTITCTLNQIVVCILILKTK